MKKLLLGLMLVLLSTTLGYSWGKTGHRVVGQIAENHLTKKAQKNIQALLGNEALGIIGNYMDFIRADRSNDHMTPWHYCTIPDGMTYEEAGVPENGDVIQTINRLIEELKSKSSPMKLNLRT